MKYIKCAFKKWVFDWKNDHIDISSSHSCAENFTYTSDRFRIILIIYTTYSEIGLNEPSWNSKNSSILISQRTFLENYSERYMQSWSAHTSTPAAVGRADDNIAQSVVRCWSVYASGRLDEELILLSAKEHHAAVLSTPLATCQWLVCPPTVLRCVSCANVCFFKKKIIFLLKKNIRDSLMCDLFADHPCDVCIIIDWRVYNILWDIANLRQWPSTKTTY